MNSPSVKQVNIRTAIPSDSARLLELVNAAYRVEDFFKYDDRLNLAELLGYLGKGFFYVTEQNNRIMACIHLEISGERGYFGLLAVDPYCQGTGLGKRMMEYVEEKAKQAGCIYMDIQVVDVRPELPLYYGKYGYKTGRTVPFPIRSKMPCQFIFMTKKLH